MAPQEESAAVLQERLKQLEAKERNELETELFDRVDGLYEAARRIESHVKLIRFRVGFIVFLMLLPLIIGFTVGFVYGLQSD